MPWLGVMTKLLRSFNYHCTHQNFCHPQCYKRQMRAAKRIMEATRHVRIVLYIDSTPSILVVFLQVLSLDRPLETIVR